jgi:hypothetical protein
VDRKEGVGEGVTFHHLPTGPHLFMLIHFTGFDDWTINTPFATIAGILAISSRGQPCRMGMTKFLLLPPSRYLRVGKARRRRRDLADLPCLGSFILFLMMENKVASRLCAVPETWNLRGRKTQAEHGEWSPGGGRISERKSCLSLVAWAPTPINHNNNMGCTGTMGRASG